MIGVDIVFIPEFARQLATGGDTFVSRAFHDKEMKSRQPEHLAGLWAAKEAVMKAAGLKPGSWLDIEISRDASGRPSAAVGEKTLEISIAHHGEYAVAVAQGEG